MSAKKSHGIAKTVADKLSVMVVNIKKSTNLTNQGKEIKEKLTWKQIASPMSWGRKLAKGTEE